MNTGNREVLTLKRVRTDIVDIEDPLYQEPLDIYDVPIRISGLPQATKTNTFSDPDYIAPYEDLTSCPIGSGSTTLCYTFTIYNTGLTELIFGYRICEGGYTYGSVPVEGNVSVCAEYTTGITIDSGTGYIIQATECFSELL